MEVSYEVAQVSLLVLDTDKKGGVDAVRSYLRDANGFPKKESEEDIRRFLVGITMRLGELVDSLSLPISSTLSPSSSSSKLSPVMDTGGLIREICETGKYPEVCKRFSPDPYKYLISLAEAYSGGNLISPFKDGKQVIDDLYRYIQAVRSGYDEGYEKGKMALEEVLVEISKKYPKRTSASLRDKRLEFMGIAMKYCIAMILDTERPIIDKNAMGGWLQGKIGELLDLSMGGLLPSTSRKTMKRHR
jgi:hypothetical protein